MDRITGDRRYLGLVEPARFNAPPGCITDAAFTASAAHALSVGKQYHRRYLVYREGDDVQPVADRTIILGIMRSAAVVESVKIRHLIAPTGDGAETVVDVSRNETSILSSPAAFTSLSTGTVSGDITSPEFAAGDVLKVNIAGDAGAGAKGYGLFIEVCVVEAP